MKKKWFYSYSIYNIHEEKLIKWFNNDEMIENINWRVENDNVKNNHDINNILYL